MVKLSILITLLCSCLFANNNYEQKGKIDMHGGKGDKIGGSFLGLFNKEKNKNDKEKIKLEDPIQLKELEDIQLKEIKK